MAFCLSSPSLGTGKTCHSPRPRTFRLNTRARSNTHARSDAKSFDPKCVCKGAKLSDTACSTKDNKMSDWNEWWIDLHSDSCKASAHNVMSARIKAAKAKGCDGVDPDNVDSVCPNPSYT